MDEADLEITKKIDNANPEIGQTVQYVIVAKNNGPNNATGVEVYLDLPIDFDISLFSVTQGTFNQLNDVWMIDDLIANKDATLIIEGCFNDDGPFNTTAIIFGDQNDPNLVNNSAYLDIIVSPSNLELKHINNSFW